MRIEKEELASLGDGQLVKTIEITLLPDDDVDKKIIAIFGNRLSIDSMGSPPRMRRVTVEELIIESVQKLTKETVAIYDKAIKDADHPKK